jgi:putative selenium metabolism hydrolase
MVLTGAQEQGILSFASALIRLPETAGHESGVASLVARQMARLGYDEVRRDGYGSLVGVLRGSRPGPALLFDGHLDVVPPGDAKAWRNPPTSGAIVEGHIWGRGAVDMKGALAAMVCAPAYLGRAALAGTVLVSASAAEEVLPGEALDRILAVDKADAVVIGEPTGLRMGVAGKGRAGVEMVTAGRPAHSSRPELGENAAYSMLEAVSRIRSMPRRSDPVLGDEVVELVEIASQPVDGWSIPDRCHTFWYCRLVTDETQGAFLARWRDALEGSGNTQVGYRTLRLNCYAGKVLEAVDFHSSWIGETGEPFHRQIEHALVANAVQPVQFAIPFACNAFASASRGIPTVVLGPGDVARAHRPNEAIPVEEILLAARVYASIAEMNSATP